MGGIRSKGSLPPAHCFFPDYRQVCCVSPFSHGGSPIPTGRESGSAAICPLIFLHVAFIPILPMAYPFHK
jgi:hypothetical protein